MQHEEIKNPNWYTWIPGIECKHVVMHFPWATGSAIKYLWRNGKKGDPIKDLNKAKECIDIQIEKIRSETLTDNDKYISIDKVAALLKNGEDIDTRCHENRMDFFKRGDL